jgi:hypothetical protein
VRMDLSLAHRLQAILCPYQPASAGKDEPGSADSQPSPKQGGKVEEEDAYTEPLSFTRFCELVDAIGSAWTQSMLLRVYSMAVRLRPGRALDTHDVVFALRTHRWVLHVRVSVYA